MPKDKKVISSAELRIMEVLWKNSPLGASQIVDELKNVINFDLPNIPETYVHRIGRTGRAGASGTAWSFCDEEDRPFLHDILKLTQQDIPLVEDHPYPMFFNKLMDASSVKRAKTKINLAAAAKKRSFKPREKPQSFHRKTL